MERLSLARPSTQHFRQNTCPHGAMVTEKRPLLNPSQGEAASEKPKDGVQLGIYLSWVKTELDNENACLELPFTLLVLISFSVFALLHLRQHETYVVEGFWKHDIEQNANFAWAQNFGHKSVYDVNSIPDFWSWLRLGFLPLAARQTWPFSEDSPSNLSNVTLPRNYTLNYGLEWDEPWGQANLPVRDEVKGFNRIVAGIRLRQERADGSWESCKVPQAVAPEKVKAWLGKPCMPADPSYELTPEAGHAEVFGEPSRVAWLLTQRKSLEELQLMVLDMEDGCSDPNLNESEPYGACCPSCSGGAQTAEGTAQRGPWLDEYTQRVEIGVVSFNQNYGLISLVTVNFFHNRAGLFHKLIHVQSAWSRWLLGNFIDQVVIVMVDVIWVSSLLFMFISEVRELVGVIRSAKYGIYQAVFHDYLNFWNAVDWVSIICAYAVIGTYVRLISETGSTTGTMGRYILEDQNALTTYQSEVWSERVFASVQSVVLAEADFRFTLMFYPIVVVVRLLKSFDAQPRLAVVTKTIYNAWKDLLHFFIVFFCVYFCLGVNSVLVFGQDMESFATLDRGLMSSFRAMFGDWDWPQMQTIGIGRIAAATWMWLFLVVVVVLLLNMMLAILLDSYSAVKSQTSSLATLNTQISEMLRRRRQSANGERVGLAELWKAYLDKFGDERQMLQSTEMVTAEEIMQQVEGIKESQAKRTLGNAKKSWEKSQEAPYTPQIYMEQLKLCGVRLRLLRGKTGEMRKAFGVADHQHLAEAVAHQETTNIVMRTVRENVKSMSKEVEEVLREECSAFEDRQEVICHQQRDFTEVIRQTKEQLTTLNGRIKEVTQYLQQIAASREIVHNVELQTATVNRLRTGMELICSNAMMAANKQSLQVDRVGPGKCKMGCSLPVATGPTFVLWDLEFGRGMQRMCAGRRPGNRNFKAFRLEVMDEHGETLEDIPTAGTEDATNWWACAEPPQSLDDVPEGLLQSAPWTDPYGRPFVTVCDPEHCYFSGLGAERVWGAGMVMANYLSTWEANGLEVVELGAGCGLPGLVLARNGASVTLTDVPWLLQMLEYNVAANFSRSDPLRPYVAPLRWGNSEDVAQVLQAIGRVPDLVMGADLVYRERDFDALLGCIESLAPKRTLLAVQRRDIALEAFMTRLKHRGWFLSSQNIAPRVFLLDVAPPEKKFGRNLQAESSAPRS
ncbi:unnamed protein product [Durusdinium trenchii]|uniref:Polycystin cation channel PKD1/PKD2 domain-containing protein n=1 Tax=Durusdinium trenchii TaxID=1381693 RepID=A0ABP0NA60_9DINO